MCRTPAVVILGRIDLGILLLCSSARRSPRTSIPRLLQGEHFTLKQKAYHDDCESHYKSREGLRADYSGGVQTRVKWPKFPLRSRTSIYRSTPRSTSLAEKAAFPLVSDPSTVALFAKGQNRMPRSGALCLKRLRCISIHLVTGNRRLCGPSGRHVAGSLNFGFVARPHLPRLPL